MQIDSKHIILALLLLFSFASNAISLYLFFSESSKLEQLDNTTAQMIKEQDQTIDQLNKRIDQLKDSNKKLDQILQTTEQDLEQKESLLAQEEEKTRILQTQLGSAQKNLSDTKKELEQNFQRLSTLKSDISEMTKELDDSMQWFEDNSYLPESHSWNVEILQTRITKDCVYEGRLNLACITHRMANTAVSLRYLEDLDAGSSDHLQSLIETADRGGGDCEDFSLFFKSIINSLKESGNDEKIIAWFPSQGSEFRVFPLDEDAESYYYYPNAASVEIGALDTYHPYVVCFARDHSSGHCAVALSQDELKSSSDIYSLDSAHVFEPQSGLYLGQIGRNFRICDEDHGDACWQAPNTILIVITDNDIYRVWKGKWNGYADFSAQLSALSAQMGQN